ncbi:MAG: HD domain-containing protein [Pseudobacteriovorax sp.]|nr:HD domain-containing protein [Pseudobacteriovorax sp.]
MSLEIVRRIRGNVHGSLDITDIEDRVIGHPFFQRLRRIKQLAFLSYVFPGATHTRFEHSLGVMHLAGVAWKKLEINQTRLQTSLARYENFASIEASKPSADFVLQGTLAPTFDYVKDIFQSDYILQALRLAALLHDVGHPPFSHSGERFLPTWGKIIAENPNLPDYLKDYLKKQDKRQKERPNHKVRHEVFSILMIDKMLREIKDKSKQLPVDIIPQDIVAIISHEIPPAPGSEFETIHALNLCRELVSGELDIDRMDYLLRDSRECGVVYGVFDAERILDSLCLYHDPEDQGLHVAITLSGLAAFEDYLRARHSMYLQLYFHKTSVAAEAMMQHIGRHLPDWHLPPKIETYAMCDEYSIGPQLKEACKPIQSNPIRTHIESCIDDLIFHRRLWKRVFEIAGPKAAIEHHAIGDASKVLLKSGIPFEAISTSNALTRFQPRKHFEKSRNYLRLIKKDSRQFPRVYAIEDFSSVIHRKIDMRIQRIYVPPELNLSGENAVEQAKSLLRN